MKLYYWQGIDLQGNGIQGEMLANSQQQVRALLTVRHVIPSKIKQKNLVKTAKISAAQIAQFNRDLATLINADVPLANSLSIIKRGTKNVLLITLLADLIAQIESGKQLSEAVKNYPNYFNEMVSNLIAVGEQSGTLNQVLEHIARYQEQQLALKRKISKALYYPLTVAFAACLITIMMMIVVIPQFANFFASFGAQLPIITQIFIHIAQSMRAYGWLLIVLIISAMMLIKINLKKSLTFKYKLEHILLRLPVLGSLWRRLILARCLHVLALTVNAGLPIVAALKITANVVQHQIYRQRILAAHQYVLAGQTLPSAVRLSQLLQERDIEMLIIGEESGTMDKLLTRLAHDYEEQLNHKINQFTQLLEPVIMLVLSAIVGLLVVAMYLPIFRLGSVI